MMNYMKLFMLFAGEPKRRKTNKLKPIEKQNGATNGDITQFQQPKKDRENFRRALVDIIMYVIYNMFFLIDLHFAELYCINKFTV